MLSGLRESLRESSGPRGRVRGYRGGYLPTERRAVERGDEAGNVRGVALEIAVQRNEDGRGHAPVAGVEGGGDECVPKGVRPYFLGQSGTAGDPAADGVGGGPIVPTRGKANPNPVVGLDFRRRARSLTAKPLVAIGGTDILFALDSIPAIFGLTQNVFLVFTATAFSLLGLRQLYFLIDGLLDRLIYLSFGLATILGFIGVKLILEAMESEGLNDVGPVHLPHIGIVASLAFIAATLTVTSVASVAGSRARTRDPEPARWND